VAMAFGTLAVNSCYDLATLCAHCTLCLCTVQLEAASDLHFNNKAFTKVDNSM
jgi:hypothetical protein